ncbi:hypothetical protein KAR91_70805 [Candidatus Pacearchaeota archaeon]|nr:hypothetical protein [Candidatus Pacearchaeota archaeon]
MDKQKLIKQLFAGKVSDILGFEKTTELLKEATEAINTMDVGQKLPIQNVSVSLPTKDEVVSEGYRIAKNADYNYRRVLKDQDHDIYYSGWMDCFDWISKGNER